MRTALTAVLLGVYLWAPPLAGAQQAPPAGPAQAPPASSQAPESKRGKHQNDLVLLGTVFNEQGFALPGAQVQVRRAGEKKVRGEDITNRLGEFSVRVPRSIEYEISVKARGFQEQSQKIEATVGDRQDFVFRMKPVTGGKK
jgi:hypothetical protein